MLIAALILFLCSFLGYGKSYSESKKVKMLAENAKPSLLTTRDYVVSATTMLICAILFLLLSHFLK